MRRFVSLVALLLFTIPFGISVSGCAKKTAVAFCSGGDTGPRIGQVQTITLSPKVFGVSLNFGLIGSISAASATDCKSNPVSVNSFQYHTTDMTIADVQPSTGRLCAGTWNRNSGAGIADYTTCNATNKIGTAYITASADGASSNPLPVYVHPTVTSVVLGAPSTNCSTDPATNCSPAAYSTSPTSCTVNPANGCCTTPLPTSTSYVQNACLSQGTTGQLAARVYAGTGAGQTNVSCQVGHPSYLAQTASVVTIDENGVATAQAPGSTIISANLSNAGSSAGFFSTCPPTSISLTVPISGGTHVSVNPNNPQPLNTIVKDKNGTILTGLTLEYVSTTPTTIPGNSTITPLFPGTAGITAICQPPSCNPSPFNQIGLFGNGTPIISNELTVTAPGKNSTALFIASTQSQYIVPVDFTTNVVGTPIRLPYVPNSIVISNDGASIYMGSATELMTFNGLTNGLSREDPTVMGKVLAVSPDNNTLVLTDPTRQLVYLYGASGGIQTQIGGIGTHAEFSPDSQTVYIATTSNQLLVHSLLTGWTTATLATPATDVAVTVPSAGAFLAGDTTTARGQCPVTSTTTVNGLATTTNQFYPDAGVVAPKTDLIAATNDGVHILGATVTPNATLTDLVLSHTDPLTGNQPGVPIGACPPAGLQFTAAPVLTSVLPGVTATAITGVTAASDSSIAFVTYTGTGGVLPTYTPQASGPGTLGQIPLLSSSSPSAVAPIAPVSGVISSDNTTFYIGTSGDNAVHLIDRTLLKDDPTKTIAPKLPGINGGIATPDLLVQRPRKSTS